MNNKIKSTICVLKTKKGGKKAFCHLLILVCTSLVILVSLFLFSYFPFPIVSFSDFSGAAVTLIPGPKNWLFIYLFSYYGTTDFYPLYSEKQY